MFKLTLSDIKRNFKLFLGTLIAVTIATAIIAACLNLIFSATGSTDRGVRFKNAQTVIQKSRIISVTYVKDDEKVKTKTKTERMDNTPVMTDDEAEYLVFKYNGLYDYTFYTKPMVKGVQNAAGHNVSSMQLTGFTLSGEEPRRGQVIIDEKLADNAGLGIGDKLLIGLKDRVAEYTISGIAANDDAKVYELQNYLYFNDDEAKEFAVGCNAVVLMSQISKSTADQLKDENYQVFTGDFVSNAELSNMIVDYNALFVIFLTMGSLCLVISMFVISGTVKFSVQNRIRTLSLLRVIGLKKGQVKRMLLMQTVLICILGGIIGSFLGVPVADVIVRAFTEMGIVGTGFSLSHLYLLDASAAVAVLLVSLIVAGITSSKPLSLSPASALKSENVFTGRISAAGIITGLVLVLGGVAVLMFTPMTKGVGIGMSFCASALFLAGAMCLTPLIMRLFNWLFSLITRGLTRSLGQVANANIRMKATKFAVASVSIAIIIAMGPMMMLNNITYTRNEATGKYLEYKDYNYVSMNINDYELPKGGIGIKNCELVLSAGEKPQGINTLAVKGALPNIDIESGDAKLGQNILLLAETVSWVDVGDNVDVWLENGEKLSYRVGGKFSYNGVQGEGQECIVSYEAIRHSFYSPVLSYAYTDTNTNTNTNTNTEGFSLNTREYYTQSPGYDIQVGASLLLGAIGLILSVIALFNTFFVIMTVRRKEFNELKVIGAKRSQLLRMTIIETLIVTASGLGIGFGILIACVGTYSLANTGIFDFVVDNKVFEATLILSSLMGLLAGIIPSVYTITKLKRQFRVE